MTEREALDFSELKMELIREYDYKCANPECQCSIYKHGTPQIAHRISQSEMNIKKYGKDVIHHRKNLVPVCSLKCNDYFNIGFNTVEAEKLADEIRDDLLKE